MKSLGSPIAHCGVITVAILSDLAFLQESLAEALARRGRYRPMPCHGAGEEALTTILRHPPRVVLVDRRMTGGLEALRRIAGARQGTIGIALSVDGDSPAEVIACAEAGAQAFLPASASIGQLTEAIDAAIEGRLQCSSSIARSLFTHVGALAAARPERLAPGALTMREAEVLDLLEHGCSNKQIARTLGIGLSTVKNHVHNILGKLGVASRGEAAAWRRQAPAEILLSLR